jgi:hypothetical protein
MGYSGLSSECLQEYLNEFCYQFNQRERETELPLRLLNTCLMNVAVKQK